MVSVETQDVELSGEEKKREFASKYELSPDVKSLLLFLAVLLTSSSSFSSYRYHLFS